MPSLDELPAAMKAARKTLGLTQAELAAKAHVSRTTIVQLETGIVPDLGFRKLAATLQAVGLELSLRPLAGPLTLNQLNEINAVEQHHALREADALVAATTAPHESQPRRGRRR